MEPLRGEDPRQVGRYRLVARLGSGGMGQVFLGFSPAGRQVAVKVVHPELARDHAFLSRFRQEASAARKVSGAYTAPVVEAGEGDLPWLATALVVGPSLADAVEQQGPLPETSVWRLAAGLAEALAEVHACGLIHRDLKPSNVLLAADGPRVIDFGISRALDSTALTGTGKVIGTPTFMSPEQASGVRAGPASDVFSFGGVVTFAATGAAPFGDGSAAAMVYRVVHGEPALDRLPVALRGLVEGCLAKRPEDRPTLGALMEVITAHVASVSPAMSFWPEALAGYIDSYRARLLSGWSPPAQEEQDRRAGPAGPHVPIEVPASRVLQDGPPTITSEQARPPTPPPQVALWPAAPPGRGRRRRMLLAAGAGLVAIAVVSIAAALAIPSSSPSASTGPTSVLTVEASEVSGGNVPPATPQVTVSTAGNAPGVLGVPAIVSGTGTTYEWTDTVRGPGPFRICLKAPAGWAVNGQACTTVTEPGAPSVLFPLTPASELG